jgi:hypothetical protein
LGDAEGVPHVVLDRRWKAKKVALGRPDPTQCNGFSSAAGTRRTSRLSHFWDIPASERLSLVDRVSIAGWLPLKIETVPEAGERAATSLVKRLPVAQETSEEIGQKRTNGPALFRGEGARFAENVGVDSQRHFGLHVGSAQRSGRTILPTHRTP